MQYVGARYVPKFMGTYDNTQAYENMCVVDNGLGTSYISKKPTPAGTPLTDTDYWAIYGASNGAIINLQNQIDDINDFVLNVEYIVTPQMFGAVGDGVTNDSAAILLAIQECFDTGKTLVFPAGDYICDQTLTFTDLTFDVLMFGTLHYTGSTIAMEFIHSGRHNIKVRLQHDLPTGSTIGLKCAGFWNNKVDIDLISGFDIGLDLHSAAANEWIAYNTFNLDYFLNCQTGLRIFADDPAGWVNENLFLNGRFQIDSDSGLTNTTGILITSTSTRAYYNNNNTFIKPCVEGNEIGIDVEYGNFNRVIAGRFESTTISAKFNNQSEHNIFEGMDITTMSNLSTRPANILADYDDLIQEKLTKIFSSENVDDYVFENGNGASLPPMMFSMVSNTPRSSVYGGHKEPGYIRSGMWVIYLVKVHVADMVGKPLFVKGYSKSGHRYLVKFFDSTNNEIIPSPVQSNMSLARTTVQSSDIYESAADRNNSDQAQVVYIPTGCEYVYIGMSTLSFEKLDVFVYSTTSGGIVERVFKQGLNSIPTSTSNCVQGDVCADTSTNANAAWKFDGSAWQTT